MKRITIESLIEGLSDIADICQGKDNLFSQEALDEILEKCESLIKEYDRQKAKEPVDVTKKQSS